MARKTKPAYPKELQRPIRAAGKIDAAYIPEWDGRVNLLFDHYDIPRPTGWGAADEASWKALAIALCFDHVPGLRFAPLSKAARRPKTWGRLQYARLRVEVRLRVEYGHLSIAAACANLARREPWLSFLRATNDTPSGATLRSRYYRAETECPQAIELAEKIERAHPGPPEQNLRIAAERLSW